MNLLLKMFKPWIKKALLIIKAEEEEYSINFINAQIMRLNLRLSGEQLDQLTKVAYEAGSMAIINRIDELLTKE